MKRIFFYFFLLLPPKHKITSITSTLAMIHYFCHLLLVTHCESQIQRERERETNDISDATSDASRKNNNKLYSKTNGTIVVAQLPPSMTKERKHIR